MIPVSSGMTQDGQLMIDLTLDWLSFTYKSPKAPADSSVPYNHFADFCKDFPELQDWIKKEGVTLARQRGWYDTILQFTDNIRINYCSSGKNSNHLGVNVEIPSHGLGFVFEKFGLSEDQVQEFFTILWQRNCKASRLDLAFDDFSKTFSPRHFALWYLDGQISTNYRRFQLVGSCSDDGGTFYLGDRGSGKILRIYDKAFESKGVIDSVRYEVELHSDYADSMMSYIRTGGDLSFSSYIGNFLRVVVRDNVRHMSGHDLPSVFKNRAHAPSLPAWTEFLRKWQVLRIVDKVKVPKKQSSVNSESLRRWVYSIAGSLRAFSDLCGDAVFSDIVARARVPDKYILSIPELSDMYYENRGLGIRKDFRERRYNDINLSHLSSIFD